MDDQIIDGAMVQALQTNVARARPIVGWVVVRDPRIIRIRSTPAW
jgi:hypothetical protein